MLITPAFAQAAAGGDTNSMLMSLLPFALIFVIMYFLILRPQQKKVKDHAELVKNIRRGDTVVTSGGLVGKVTKVVDDDQIEFEISDGVRVRQMRQMISGVRAKGEPAKEKAEPAKDEDVRELSSCAPHFPDLTGQLDVVFHAVEGAGDHPDGAGGVPLRRSELLSRSHGQDLAEMGAAPSRARPRSAGRLAISARGRCQLGQEGQARSGSRRRAPRRCAMPRSAIPGLTVRNDTVEVRISKDTDLPTALAKLRELSQPLGGLLGSSGQRSLEVSDAGGGLIRLTVPQAAITDRIRQDDRAIDPDRRAARQRTRHRRAADPAPGRRPHSGAGAGPAGSDAAEGHPRQDRQDGIPHGRLRPCRRIRPRRAGCRRIPKLLMSAQAPKAPYVIKKQVLVSGGELTDAQPGFDQRTGEPIVSFRFNTSGSRKFAQATTENVGQPFAIVLDNKVISAPVIREPITGGSGPDFRQLHRAVGQRSGDPAARRRAAGAADHHRGAHRRSRPRPGLRSRRANSPPMSARSSSSCSCC